MKKFLFLLAAIVLAASPAQAITVCTMSDGGAVSGTTEFWTSDSCGGTPATVSHTAAQILTYIEGSTTLPSVVFRTYSVSGQSDIVADTATDTMTIAAGAGMTITTNAGTDTLTLANTSRTIGNVAFDGSANIVPETSAIIDSTDSTSFPLMVDSATGNLQPKTDGGLLYNASNGTLSSTIFNTPTLTLTGTGTLNDLDAINSTTETTLEAAIDIAGDVSGTGLNAVTIGADKVLESHLKSVNAATDEFCLTSESTTGDFEWQPCMQTVEVVIPAASVLTLSATPVTLVAAPGANKMLVFDHAIFFLDYNSSAYAGIGATEDLAIKYANSSGTQVSSPVETTGFMEQTSDQYRLTSDIYGSTLTVTPQVNQPLVLHMLNGEITTGNSILYVQMFYRIEDVSALGP